MIDNTNQNQPPNSENSQSGALLTSGGKSAPKKTPSGTKSTSTKKKGSGARLENYLVVGIGASAAGSSTLEQFFANVNNVRLRKTTQKTQVKEKEKVAFIVVTHLVTNNENQNNLVAALKKHTDLEVIEVTHQIPIKPDVIYVIPPTKQLMMKDGNLDISDLENTIGERAPIDLFFRTLAQNFGDWSVAIVLSGPGTDGSIGLPRIKEAGGLTIAQDPTQAENNQMPRSAITTGFVDVVLPVEQMGEWLLNYNKNKYLIDLVSTAPTSPSQSPVTHNKVLQPVEADNNFTEGNEIKDEASKNIEKNTHTSKDNSDFDTKNTIYPVEPLVDIFALLRTRTGHDFTQYKKGTLKRRIEQRMQVNDLPDLTHYLSFIQTHPSEIQALMRDLLISVTNFFRDKEVWQHLELNVIPQLFSNNGKENAERTVRVWIAGCATGEEAYSLAILLHEYASHLKVMPRLQIFATDMDENAITIAREGIYPETIALDVSPARLQGFFNHSGRGYRVRKEIRETILFAKHDLLKDPPFSRINLVSCRNLLIYLNREAQGQILSQFHFSLNPNGVLVLGTSETTDSLSQLFSSSENSKKYHIYTRQVSTQELQPLERTSPLSGMEIMSPTQNTSSKTPVKSYLTRLPDLPNKERNLLPLELTQILQGPFAIAGAVLDPNFVIVYFSERAGRYLQMRGGEPSYNLLRLVVPELRIELRTKMPFLNQAKLAETSEVIKTRWIKITLDGIESMVRLNFQSLTQPTSLKGFFLVTFDEYEIEGMIVKDATRGTHSQSETNSQTPNQSFSPAFFHEEVESFIQSLQDEIASLKRDLQLTIEQYEVNGEEHKASNEELQAVNEELRSATEEMETSREELQALNEELLTVNAELKIKYEEASSANNDLQNLMISTDIATIFLDRLLQIKRYTPKVELLFNIIPTDVGRALAHLTHRLEYTSLVKDAGKVLANLQPLDLELRTVDNGGEAEWYLVRILPYRSLEDKIDGVVITFTNITERKRTEITLHESEVKYRTLFDSIDEGFHITELIYDEAGKVVDYRFLEVNQVFERQTGLKNAAGKLGSVVAPNTEPSWLENYDRVVRTGQPVRFESYNEAAERWYSTYASRVGGAESRRIAVVFDDITERKRDEQQKTFLTEFSRDLVELTNTPASLEQLGEKIGQFFEVKWCVFAELVEDDEISVAANGWNASDVVSLKGSYRMRDYYTNEQVALSNAGTILVVNDVQTDSRVNGENYSAIGIRSFITVPQVQSGQWTLQLSIIDNKVRDWKPEDVALLVELTSRIWVRMERGRAEEALRESQAMLQSFYDTAPFMMGIGEIDDDNNRTIPVSGNQMTAYYFGKQTENLPGQSALEIGVSIQTQALWLEQLRKSQKAGTPVHFEYEDSQTRETIWLSITVAIIGAGSSGRPQYSFIAEDITARKHEEQRQEFLLKLSDALRPLNDPTQIQRVACQLVAEYLQVDRCYYSDVNLAENWTRVEWDYTRDEVLSIAGIYPLEAFSWTLDSLIKGETFVLTNLNSLSSLSEAEREAMSSIYAQAMVCIPLNEAGVWVGCFAVTQSTPRQWKSNEIELIREVGERIWATVERARVEKALSESEQNLQGVTNIVPDLLWYSEPDGSTVWYNERWLEYTGQSLEEATGWGWVEAIHPEDRETSVRNYQQAIEKSLPLAQEHRIRSASGEYRYFLVRSEPLLNDQGQIVRMYGAATDIHEQRMTMLNMEQRVKERTVDLAEANLRLGVANDQLQKDRERLHQLSIKLLEVQETERRFLAKELHDEIGQYLTGLKFMLETSLNAPSEKRVSEFMETISIIDDLTVRVRELSLNLRPTLLDDMGLLTALASHIQRYSAQTRIQVNFYQNGLERRFPASIETAVYRIVQEALNNVAKYAKVEQVLVQVISDGQLLVLIQDEGPGFDLAVVEARHNSTGLSAMRERVELHGGTFTITSEPGYGTTISAEIPVDFNIHNKDTPEP